MTVELRYEEGSCALRVEGHAGYRPGNDIVCAGCSAVVYALMGALQNEGAHVKTMAAETESGHAWVYAEGDEAAGALFRMAEVGLRQIEKAHPEHVRVIHTALAGGPRRAVEPGRERKNERNGVDAARQGGGTECSLF